MCIHTHIHSVAYIHMHMPDTYSNTHTLILSCTHVHTYMHSHICMHALSYTSIAYIYACMCILLNILSKQEKKNFFLTNCLFVSWPWMVNLEYINIKFSEHGGICSVLNNNSSNIILILSPCLSTCLEKSAAFFLDAVVKQRMQVYGSGYRTCLQCVSSVLRKEGMWAFYRSYSTQLVMNVPFQSIQFVTYEIMQDLLNNDRAYSPLTHVCSGAVAGAVAASVTMPLDVCKTLLNTQEACARTNLAYINGMATAFRTIYEFRGVAGFFRGLQARVVYQMPSTAIAWSVYEFFKFVITHHNHSDDGYLTAQVPVGNVNGVNVHAASSVR